jgi:Protein of unknown function (DUF1579)
MRLKKCCTISLLPISAMLGISYVPAEDKPDFKTAAPEREEMHQKMEADGKPSIAHKALDVLVGEWTAEVTYRKAYGAPPVMTKGTSKSSWVINMRFVKEDFTGDSFGKPFHGMSLMGYDNTKEKYTSVWLDDISSAITHTRSQSIIV